MKEEVSEYRRWISRPIFYSSYYYSSRTSDGIDYNSDSTADEGKKLRIKYVENYLDDVVRRHYSVNDTTMVKTSHGSYIIAALAPRINSRVRPISLK